MPLDKSGGKKAVGKNIATEVAAGKQRKQAIAIALSTQDKSKGKGKAKKKKVAKSPFGFNASQPSDFSKPLY